MWPLWLVPYSLQIQQGNMKSLYDPAAMGAAGSAAGGGQHMSAKDMSAAYEED